MINPPPSAMTEKYRQRFILLSIPRLIREKEIATMLSRQCRPNQKQIYRDLIALIEEVLDEKYKF